MGYSKNLTVDDFKNYFDRAFTYAPVTDPNNTNYVRDKDILNAYSQADLNFNEALFGEDNEKKLAFLFLTAHYLCMDAQMDRKGLNSQGEFIMTSKSVDSVSASYAIPQVYQNDPTLNYFAQTQFGCKYLSLIIPRAIGRVAIVRGTTTDE